MSFSINAGSRTACTFRPVSARAAPLPTIAGWCRNFQKPCTPNAFTGNPAEPITTSRSFAVAARTLERCQPGSRVAYIEPRAWSPT